MRITETELLVYNRSLSLAAKHVLFLGGTSQSRLDPSYAPPKDVEQQRSTLRQRYAELGPVGSQFLEKLLAKQLGAELKPLARDARLQDIDQTLVLVDGSLISALPSIMEASWRKQNKGSGLVKWRWAPTAGWSTHFEVDRYVPARIDLPAGRRHARRWRRA